MLTPIAKLVSYIFHPLFVPIYGLYLLFNTGLYINFSLNEAAINTIYAIVFFNTIFMPAGLIYFFYKRGYLNSFMVEHQQQRHILYITIIIFYYSTYMLFESFSVPIILSSFVLGAAIAILILFIANFFSKVSAHMVGAGGILGMLYLVSDLFLSSYSLFLIPVIILSGIIAFSRLKLNAHNPSEIYLGLLIGFTAEYCTVYYNLLY